MIIFGGHTLVCTAFGNGKRYDPGTDSWTAISTINAPDARFYHTAVWTGSEMIVWGGQQCPPVRDFQHGGQIQSTNGQLDRYDCHQRACWPRESHRSLDWQRNDHLGEALELVAT